MVESINNNNSTTNITQSVVSKDRKDIFTQYIEVQDMLMHPFKPLIHIVGFQETHSTITQIMLEGVQQQNTKSSSNFFKMYNIQSYEFYDSGSRGGDMPLIYKETSLGGRIKAGPTDLGFLKYSFFKSLTLFKPAVTILVFDWQNQQVDSSFDWKAFEAQVLAEIKQHQDKCPGSRQSKFVLLIFLPLNDQSNVDDKIVSLKRAVAARGDENIKTFFLLTNGFEGLKNISKKFVKVIYDLSSSYYQEKKLNIKKKQKKLIKDEIGNIRYSFKHGILSAFTKNDMQKPIKYMKEAYHQLRMSIGNSGVRTPFEEKRENADLITIKICQMYLQSGNHAAFLEMQRQHFYTFQTKINLLRREQRFEELKWRANWMRLMGQFLEMHPAHEEKLEYFSGYYNYNCMVTLISRKQEFMRLVKERGDALRGIEDMKNMVAKFHNFIGKDVYLQDLRDPLGGNTKTQHDQKALVEKFKVFQESVCDVDSVVLEFAQKSISQYKSKSRQLKGNSGTLFRRMIHFITYHISEFVLAQQDQTGQKTQKYRGQIARSLIQEGWIQEALNFVEKAKANARQNLEDFFIYEMEILNYDRVIKDEERQRRFYELIQQVKNTPVEIVEDENIINTDAQNSGKPLQLITQLVGPKLIWARANFDLGTIQVNKYNKLNVEICSQLEQDINISKIVLRFNENTMNQEIVGNFVVSKSKPINLQRELYISKDNQMTRDFIQFTEIYIELLKNNDDVKQTNELAVLIKPYLKPEESLLDFNGLTETQQQQQQQQKRRPIRLKEPIKFNIEPMPLKVKFRFQKDENKDQALLGDYHNVYFYLEPEDITLTELSLSIENVDIESNINHLSGSVSGGEVQLDNQNLMISQTLDDQRSSTQASLNSSQLSFGSKHLNVVRHNSSSNNLNSNTMMDPFGLNIQEPQLSQAPLSFTNQKSKVFKDVEIFYLINPSLNKSADDQQQIAGFEEIDYTQEDHKLELPLDTRSLRLGLKFYQEGNNTVNLIFKYAFTQNSDKEDQKQVMRQLYRKSLKIQSQSPFKINWEIKNSDPYIQNLRLRNEALQLAPLVAPYNEECWVNCTFTSQSICKEICLQDVSLDIIDINKVKKLNTLQNSLQQHISKQDIRLSPGESFEQIFKIKISNIDNNGQESPSKIKNEIDQFADLIFSWYSISQQDQQDQQLIGINGNMNGSDNLLDLSTIQNTANHSQQQLIQCTIPSPHLTLIDIPIKIKILNDELFAKAQLHKPINLELELLNQSMNVIDTEFTVEESDDFYIGGELKSYISFMPGEKYLFRFNLIPLTIGRLSLPKFNVSEILDAERQVVLIKGFTRKCLVFK